MAYPLLLPVISFIAGLVLAGVLELHFYVSLLSLLLASWLATWLVYFLKKIGYPCPFFILTFSFSGLVLEAFSSKVYDDHLFKISRQEPTSTSREGSKIARKRSRS